MVTRVLALPDYLDLESFDEVLRTLLHQDYVGQAYSKIDMANRSHSLGLRSHLFGLEFPSGEAQRPAHVKREIPGTRGRTRNQTTRKRTKTK